MSQPPECKNRMHTWEVNPPKKGTTCIKCGRGYRIYRPRQPKAEKVEPSKVEKAHSPTGEPTSPAVDLTKLQQRWKPVIVPPVDSVTATTTTTEKTETPSTEPKPEGEKSTVSLGTLAQWLGQPLTEFLVELARKRIEKKGYLPNLPDPEWQEKLQECVDKLLREKLPSVEMTPLVGTVVSLILIYVSMRWNAKPLDQAERAELLKLRKEKEESKEKIKVVEPLKLVKPAMDQQISASADTKNSAKGSDDTNQLESIYSSLPTDNSWLMGGDGSAKNAEQLASAV